MVSRHVATAVAGSRDARALARAAGRPRGSTRASIVRPNASGRRQGITKHTRRARQAGAEGGPPRGGRVYRESGKGLNTKEYKDLESDLDQLSHEIARATELARRAGSVGTA